MGLELFVLLITNEMSLLITSVVTFLPIYISVVYLVLEGPTYKPAMKKIASTHKRNRLIEGQRVCLGIIENYSLFVFS